MSADNTTDIFPKKGSIACNTCIHKRVCMNKAAYQDFLDSFSEYYTGKLPSGLSVGLECSDYEPPMSAYR